MKEDEEEEEAALEAEALRCASAALVPERAATPCAPPAPDVLLCALVDDGGNDVEVSASAVADSGDGGRSMVSSF